MKMLMECMFRHIKKYGAVQQSTVMKVVKVRKRKRNTWWIVNK